MRTGTWASVVVVLLCIAVPRMSLAGQLSGFEDAVAKPGSPSRSDESRYRDDAEDPTAVADVVVGAIAALGYGTYRGVKWLVHDWWAGPGGEAGRMVDSPDGADQVFSDDELDGFDHQVGTPGMPFLRVDYRWQYLSRDLEANDFLLEAGYRYVALYGRVTQYESASSEQLDIGQYYGMVRYGGTDEFYFPGSFQVAAGIGGYSIRGDQSQSGPALTVPVMVYPSDWFGFEFRPAWASINNKTVSDYDVSRNVGHKFTRLCLGYRWFWVQHEGGWLDGPYAGLSLSF